jgi:hypothetical protein
MQVWECARRTITLDATRALGIGGPIDVVASGRDERWAVEGARQGPRAGPGAGAAATLRLVTQPEPEYEIETIDADPAAPGIAQLVGSSARNGFRPHIGVVDLGVGADAAILRRILEDVPAVVSLSRLALIHADAADERRDPNRRSWGRRAPVDVCAGWAAGSSMTRLVEQGRSPIGGHDDPVVFEGDDLASPDRMPLQVGWFRRRRRMDVSVPPRVGTGPIRVDGRFRDSYVLADGAERVEHEYRFVAEVDHAGRRILSCVASPSTLPAHECANARGSAAWLVGVPLDEVASTVRSRFKGPLTCTHLNEALHGLADVEGLLNAMPTRTTS